MTVRRLDSIKNQVKTWSRWEYATQWFESRSSYSAVLGFLASFLKRCSITDIFLRNLRIFGNTSGGMFLNTYNLKISKDSGLHHKWFSWKISDECVLMGASFFSTSIQCISNKCSEIKDQVNFFHWINGNYNLQYGCKYWRKKFYLNG